MSGTNSQTRRGLPSSSEEGQEPSGYWSVPALQLALPAPDVHRTGRLPVPLPACAVGGLVLGTASRLDALSVYPVRGRLRGHASGETTATP